MKFKSLTQKVQLSNLNLGLLVAAIFVFGFIVGVKTERYYHPKDAPIIFEVIPEQPTPQPREYWIIPNRNMKNDDKPILI